MSLLAATSCPEDVNPCSGLLDFNLTLVVQLAIFLITVFVLWKVLWRPIVSVLEARDHQIAAGIEAAQEAERKLLEAKAEITKVLDDARRLARDEFGAATRAATADASEAREKAREQAETEVASARAEVAAERAKVVGKLSSDIETLVGAAVSRVLGTTVDIAAHRNVIKEFVPQ